MQIFLKVIADFCSLTYRIQFIHIRLPVMVDGRWWMTYNGG